MTNSSNKQQHCSCSNSRLAAAEIHGSYSHIHTRTSYRSVQHNIYISGPDTLCCEITQTRCPGIKKKKKKATQRNATQRIQKKLKTENIPESNLRPYIPQECKLPSKQQLLSPHAALSKNKISTPRLHRLHLSHHRVKVTLQKKKNAIRGICSCDRPPTTNACQFVVT